MKIITLLITAVFCISFAHAQKKPLETHKGKRVEKIINSNWTFNYFPSENADKGYETQGFNDSRWQAISIPHTWNTFETTGDKHPFIMNASEKDNPYWWIGWGWYRKHFTVNTAYSDRKVFIEFEGVQKYCKVWVNGRYLGDHKGGYGSFDFDITAFIRPGVDNVLAVAVNNQQNDKFSIPPMAAGNFNVYGGIYRDVTIVLKDKIYIPMQGSAVHEGGTYITTPKVNEKEGVVRVQTWVKNDYPQPKKCIMKTTISDATDKIVQVLESVAEINPLQQYRFDQTSTPIKLPHLWSPENPYLYKVNSEVFIGAEVVDTYSSPLGFRWFQWDYKDNFLYINGKKTVLYGGNRHQEYPWLGDAIPKWITVMDFLDMAENLNYNFIRTAHYPNDKLVYDLSDKYGIVVSEESPGFAGQMNFAEIREQQLKEMIRRDRNHPSIIFWSMGRVTDHTADLKVAVAEDTSRIISTRNVSGGSSGSNIQHSDENLLFDNLPRCTVRGWYNKDVKGLEPSDGQQSGTEEHQQNMLKASGKLGTGNFSTWLYQDHGADREYLNAPLLHISPQGYVDLYRIPKYAYYLWQATYYDKPMVFIQPHYWRSQYLGQKQDIVVNSNCDKVELKVNGVSKGFQTPDYTNSHSVTFKDIVIEKGTLQAVATKAGKSVMSQVVMAGEPARIVLKGSQQKFAAERSSVAIITADIVDSKGNHVYGATNSVRWSVTGPAVLAGPSEYESDISRHQATEGVWYMDMPVSNVLRSTGKAGKIKVIVTAGGLASGSFEIEAVENIPDNSVVTETILDDQGRRTVDRPFTVAHKPVAAPREIQLTADEIRLPPAEKVAYSKMIKERIHKNNPSIDTSTVEFKALTDVLTSHLINNNGILAADDYNFNVDHYNNCRLIASYIPSTKLPPLFKEGLKMHYAISIIAKGQDKNPVDEMNWLNWIPSGGTVVVSVEKKSNIWPKGTIITDKVELTELIALVHQGFPSFSDEAKVRALKFISKMNPFIKVQEISEIDSEGKKITKVSYTTEREQPILIPLLKFIAE